MSPTVLATLKSLISTGLTAIVAVSPPKCAFLVCPATGNHNIWCIAGFFKDLGMVFRHDRAALPQSCRNGLRHNKSLQENKLRYLPPCRSRFTGASCVPEEHEPQHMVYRKRQDSAQHLVGQQVMFRRGGLTKWSIERGILAFFTAQAASPRFRGRSSRTPRPGSRAALSS